MSSFSAGHKKAGVAARSFIVVRCRIYTSFTSGTRPSRARVRRSQIVCRSRRVFERRRAQTRTARSPPVHVFEEHRRKRIAVIKSVRRNSGHTARDRDRYKGIAIIKSIAALKTSGAGDEARTRYLHLGKVALYQMSYARIWCSPNKLNCMVPPVGIEPTTRGFSVLCSTN